MATKAPKMPLRKAKRYNINAWITPEHGAALEQYRAVSAARVSKTAAVEKAIELLAESAGIRVERPILSDK